jgi:hypothetical protein
MGNDGGYCGWDNDGYFFVKIHHHVDDPLYAYNIENVVDLIASSESLSRPSNDEMLLNALASWPISVHDTVIWLSIPNHHSNGLIAIQSRRDGSIRVYSVPSYCSPSSSSQHHPKADNTSRDLKGEDGADGAIVCDYEAKNGSGNDGNNGVIGSRMLYMYDMKANGDQRYGVMVSIPVQYDYDMNEIIMEWITIILMCNEVGWTITPLVALVLSYLL